MLLLSPRFIPFAPSFFACLADTSNSCVPPGYDDFNPDSWNSECAPTKADWFNPGVGPCGDGDKYPEEYWNCADVTIVADGTSTSLISSSGTFGDTSGSDDASTFDGEFFSGICTDQTVALRFEDCSVRARSKHD